MAKPLALLVFLVCLPLGGWGAQDTPWAIDYPILRDSICQRETQGVKFPWLAVSPDGRAWGECQIQYWTAVEKGGLPRGEAPSLFNRKVNRAIALQVLQSKMAKFTRLTGLSGEGAIRSLVVYYRDGLIRRQPEFSPYVEEITLRYQARRTKAAKARLMPCRSSAFILCWRTVL